MKYREAFFEASIRSGEPREQARLKFEWIVLNGKLPPNWDDEIPSGQEEREITWQMVLKRHAETRPLPEQVSNFQRALKLAAQNRRQN